MERLRHLIPDGYHGEARQELLVLRHLTNEAVYLNGEMPRLAVDWFL